MIMKSEELKTLLEIKQILSTIVGTSHLPEEMQFSTAALDKIAKEFKKLRKEDNQWVRQWDISKYVKNARNAAAFIRNELKFENCYKKGGYHYYKKDLIHLNKELIARNINLERYMELKADKERVEKARDKYPLRKQKKVELGRYKIPDDLRNIDAKPKKVIPMQELRAEFDQLLKDFEEKNLSEHIELTEHQNTYLKNVYYYGMTDETRLTVKRWIKRFNTVKYEIEERTKHRK